ncbi:hypothetical protein F3Y22_tig00110879pilonHSYRG00019 [Hibiscus syriacus]|uniref:Uncharacterized protein n=1 Tax=Hibiscus syriacus TaxID=106335 RepID=A0A6A2ZLH1_HIBSY|nr:hypothetical protein F3Y22_tig00110879pilonHSYRG00019 [Hibiscus syriacus]
MLFSYLVRSSSHLNSAMEAPNTSEAYGRRPFCLPLFKAVFTNGKPSVAGGSPTNKARRLDEEPPDAGSTSSNHMDIEGINKATLETSPSPTSYRDTLLKDNPTDPSIDEEIMDEEDVEVFEDDVVHGVVDAISSSNCGMDPALGLLVTLYKLVSSLKLVNALGRSKHLTIVLSENTNPNTADDIISHATQGNSHHKLIPRKPPNKNHAQVSDEPHLSTDGKLTDPAQCMNVMQNNCIESQPGCGHPRFLTVFQQYLRDFKPYLVAILEPRISGGRAEVFIAATGFPRSHRIEAIDFNATLTTSDRKNLTTTTQPCRYFQDFVYDFGSRDMGFQGPEFTWNRGLSYARLDRALCNRKWDESYPETAVHHLHRMRSDHRPLLLCVDSPMANIHPSQFRCFSGWLQHDDFSRMVEDNWVNSETLSGTISHLTEAADTWNKTVFGYIGTKKKIIMVRLRGVHISLNRFHSNFLINLEVELLIELEKLLDQEETLWKQRSRVNWTEVIHSMRQLKTKQGWMAIKVDLEKAFDRLRWDFIQDSLTDAGFPVSTIRVIMHCISLASMQIQWNGEYTPDFKPQWGIRQGHKVSKRKTHIYFSPNTVTEMKTVILSCLGFQEVDHMGKYLGVSVLHSRRVTLAKSILSAIPTYFMQVMSFPKRVCDEIESVNRLFIWGSEPSERKISLVNWSTVCTPIDRGGLGLICPLEQNKAFLIKLGYFIMALSQVLVPVAIPHVLNAQPPEATDISDALVWKWDPKHQFTIKSAYTFLIEDSWRNLWSRVVPHSTFASFFGTDLQSWITQNIHKQQPHVTNPTWSPPPRGWMCLNTDGAVVTLDGRGSIGLLIARNLGIHMLWIQSDCSRAVKLVGESGSIDIHIPLLRVILKLRQSGCWVTKIQWISMNGNKIADRMEKLASRQHYNLVHFDSPPPDELADLLALDDVVAQQTDESIRA